MMSSGKFLLTGLAVLLTVYTSVSRAEELPSYIHICQKDDPQLNQCMITSIENLKSILAVGVPELDIPSLEPLILGDLLVGGTSGSGLKITVKGTKAYGASNFRIKKLDVVEYGRSYKFLLLLPHLYVEGRYDIDGRVLVLPIKGSGKFTGNFTRCVADVTLNTEPRQIGGADHVIVRKLNIQVKVGRGSLNLDNLFGGDKTLGEVVNQTINQNFDAVSQDLIPLIEKALERHFKKTSNKIMSRYTQQQLFPE